MHFTKELLEHITEEVGKKGFQPTHLGYYRDYSTKEEKSVIKYKDGLVFHRESPVKEAFLQGYGCGKLGEILDDFGGQPLCPPNTEPANPQSNHVLEQGSSTPMGSPEVKLTPLVQNAVKPDLPTSNFELYESLVRLRSEKDSLLIGFDGEWYYEPDGLTRVPISLQFAVVWEGVLHEFILLCDNGETYSLESVLSRILGLLGYNDYRVDKYTYQRACVGFNGDGVPVWEKFTEHADLINASYRIHPLYRNKDENGNLLPGWSPAPYTIDEGHALGKLNKFASRVDCEWRWSQARQKFPETHNVTVICHAGRVDLSLLKTKEANGWLMKVSEIQGGTVSLNSISLRVSAQTESHNNSQYVYPITLNFRDTMAQAPAGYKGLEALGDAINLPKLKDEDLDKEHMDRVLADKPSLFFEYASRDSVITLLYSSSVYGYNKEMGVSLMSSSTKSICEIMMDYLGCKTVEEYDRIGRGLMKVDKGKVKNPNGPGFLEESNKEPITALTGEIQSYASQSFHGGLNTSSYIGYIKEKTVDYDLQNAYPTAMALLEDIDYEDPVEQEFNDTYLDLKPWFDRAVADYNPMTPILARVKFEFPKDVKFPCIPQNVAGRLLSVRQFGFRDGEDVVYAAGPEIYLALQMGAKVYCQRGFKLNRMVRPREDDPSRTEPSRSVAHAVKMLVDERGKAKKAHGNKSLEELVMKVMVNGGYGKIAQNVIDKRTWSSKRQEMEGLRESAITDPVKATLITSYVRAMLYATMEQSHRESYTTYSGTTDGNISNITNVGILENFDLFGFTKITRTARVFLTGNPTIWEPKHEQDEFYNLTTRGNMAWDEKGVNAHNSTKSGFKSGSIEDREWFLLSCLEREGRVRYADTKWTTFKEMTKDKTSFRTVDVVRNVSMDFDMKRKPIRESFHTVIVTVQGVDYEVANFDTEPFDNLDEALLYEQKKKLCPVLRTQEHWNLFFAKVDSSATGKQIRVKDGLEWSKLVSCVMGARTGLWTIPELSDTNTTVAQKCEWLNSLGLTPKKFKPSDWKNARRPERQVNALPITEIQDFLEIMGAIDIKL